MIHYYMFERPLKNRVDLIRLNEDKWVERVLYRNKKLYAKRIGYDPIGRKMFEKYYGQGGSIHSDLIYTKLTSEKYRFYLNLYGKP